MVKQNANQIRLSNVPQLPDSRCHLATPAVASPAPKLTNSPAFCQIPPSRVAPHLWHFTFQGLNIQNPSMREKLFLHFGQIGFFMMILYMTDKYLYAVRGLAYKYLSDQAAPQNCA